MSRLRLLIALDALLVEGSVSRAAERLGMGAPAMSRLLAQIREMYDDPILVRTGRGMVPTPLAERLRVRLRALATEADALLDASAFKERADTESQSQPASGLRMPLLQAPPLAMRPTVSLEGYPSPEALARRLDAIASDAEPQKRLAKYIAITGGGAGRSRPLSIDEADEAMSIILDGDADPIQIGALLVAMHYRGLVAPELAGLVRAARRKAQALPSSVSAADLDWPAYLSPRRGSAPWFLFSAKLVAQAGKKILLHGFGSEEGHLAEALKYLGVPVCRSLSDAWTRLEEANIAFLPLNAISGQLQALIGLYTLFEMRSPLNLLVHLLNPLGSKTSLLGVPGPSSQMIHRDAAALLGWRDLTVVSTSRDVAQFTPFRATPLIRLQDGVPGETVVPSIPEPHRQAKTGLSTIEYWRAVWEGAARDERAQEIIISTAAAALELPGKTRLPWEEARAHATSLWEDRHG